MLDYYKNIFYIPSWLSVFVSEIDSYNYKVGDFHTTRKMEEATIS